ncbi:exonuclease [Natronolimnobius baerhuensis]|uniref:Exonuclease n=1 Tax=Natronolimnobius baerhuensis TaxID=253108 RepID=A0A202ED22_9EURY|nr:exonuclease [Natronolimnobius baerhuensis]OVE86132.1 exonuclease [Natronolimnobius baerhuensis]
MSTDGRSASDSTTASALESASFVRLVTKADGDGLAASGLVARALAARGTPFQVTVGRTVATRTERAQATTGGDGDLTLVVGSTDATNATRLDTDDRPATLAAVDHVRDLGETPDLVLALAGLVAAGVEPGAGESEWLIETARERGLVERRPGVAIPTADPVDGLAHSTRVSAPWSGDVDATHETLSDAIGADLEAETDRADDADASGTTLEHTDHRALGSVVALDAVSAEAATAAAAESIQRVLKPYATPDAPFETVGGYADVLEATAQTEPGTGAALAMGHDAREPALAVWREYGRRAHNALEAASTGRYDGLFVVGIDDGPVEAVAALSTAFRSPEPLVLAVGAGEAALATREGTLPPLEGVARDLESVLEGTGDATDQGVTYDVTASGRRGYLQYDPAVDETTIIETVREYQ